MILHHIQTFQILRAMKSLKTSTRFVQVGRSFSVKCNVFPSAAFVLTSHASCQLPQFGHYHIRPIHSYLPSVGHGSKRMKSTHDQKGRDPEVEKIIKRLRKLGSGPLCDADKSHRYAASTSDDPNLKAYAGLGLMCPLTMSLRNSKPNIMVGVVRTVQLARPNDFLPVLYALTECRSGDVLVINTSGSTRAVAGGLFTTDAARRGLNGIVIDGPVRDIADLDSGSTKRDGSLVSVYSTSVTPYAGTAKYPGEGVDAAPVLCGGVTASPGDIIFGDADGVLVGSPETFSSCLHDAENIVAIEQNLMKGMKMGVSLHSMTNFDEHFKARKEGRESALQFKDLNTIKFTGVDPLPIGTI